ncbi:ubl carboxyl-terminal hydrolase 18 [Colossoma macropomum]|uniref:ubl carboxyl-terminal hydrolase 18 n=1 Tax=Colossoma macropomum TaxID=42526 RepID=UPI0018651E61|nr:ubl carboxyl-terminal hydrolase 18 [Colossoma macropomum]
MGMSLRRSVSLDLSRASGVRGLSNYSLSCCVNALLQSFSATTELFELLNRWQPSDESEDPHNVPLQLKRALHAMRDPQQPAPHHAFLDCLHHNYILRYAQHDADEVFHAILNLIQQQVPDPSLAAEIKNLYKITVEGQIHCLKCAYVHCVSTFFLSLPLHVSEDKNTLEDCIRSFFAVQKLEHSEEFFCDRCEEKQPTAQGFKIVSLPSILCIHLKRFRSGFGFARKLFCEVTFPESFNMADILKEGKLTQEMLEGNYNLFAVIVHSGFFFGHYTAYIHSMQDQTWYFTNDSQVYQASWKDVQQTYGGRLKNNTAYMLLYRRDSTEMKQGSSR